MSSDIRRYGNSGIHTVEGNIAGVRAARLTKEREIQQNEYEERKQKIELDHQRGARIDGKFASYKDKYEAEFKRQTVGLVTAEEFRKRRANLYLNEEKDDESTNSSKITKKKKVEKKKKVVLSFGSDDDEVDQDNEELVVLKTKKDPTIDTHFLPDRDRELTIEKERKRLKVEWEEEQQRIKEENVTVTYSYWDGTGHRKEITVTKGTTIGKFLDLCRQQIAKEFPEVRGISSENLLYVKEDLLIPHHYTFYDLIVTKARGKSGPLFHFDVHDDVRLINDVRIEKDESHPGKVVERHWYEKNKHIFPASRWETYDPSKKWERYTIHGDEVGNL